MAINAAAMPGATTLRLVEPASEIAWNDDMMPHTVPNKPMYGVMEAVVARNGTRCSSLAISVVEARSSARSTPSRLLSVGRDAGSAGRWSPDLRGEFCIARLKQTDERTRRQARADGLHLGEATAFSEDREKLGVLLRDASELAILVGNHAPRHRRKQQEHEHDRLLDPMSLHDERDDVERGLRILESQDHQAKRAQRHLHYAVMQW